ncbi:MAG TPA: capsule biosynthesis protein [Clostridiales bacterium]|nr:capsule biosynthesis protein [Clostridiales bacterium]
MNQVMTFSATGDSFVTRCHLKQDSEFQKVKEVIRSAQARFTNLEVTIHDMEGFPSAQSGGTWAVASPKTLDSIKDYGFNLIGTANNHALDYSYGGLEATLKHLDEYELVHTGTGRNLSEAGQPVYLDCPSGRVALISITSSFHESWVAGEQRKDVPGRPGVNPLRFSTTYLCKTEEFDALKKIAHLTGINSYDDMIRKEGFLPELQEDEFMFGQYSFKKSQFSCVETKPLEKDMKRLENSIAQAKGQADYVIVSIHSHQIKGANKDHPADFLVAASKRCIDAGAHAVLGHGPHVLRGIEIYKNKPIFYSLGNFIFQSETVSVLPADFYEKYGLGPEHHVTDALQKRSNNGTRGLSCDPDAMGSVIATWTMKEGVLSEIKMISIELGYGLPPHKSGWPRLSDRIEVLERMDQLSKPFGTSIRIQEGIGFVEF